MHYLTELQNMDFLVYSNLALIHGQATGTFISLQSNTMNVYSGHFNYQAGKLGPNIPASGAYFFFETD